MSALSFTGERFLPECSGGIRHEHCHRYALARDLGRGKSVLDVASGEGYGSAMLAGSAARVVGADVSPEAVQHARTRYGHLSNLEFIAASCDRLPLPDASFDLAVSFETIEHIETQQEFIAELARVLRPDGLLLISSPNKRAYSDALDYHNEYHVRELYRDELEHLLRPAFPHILWFGQKLLFHSTIWPETQDIAATEYWLDEGEQIHTASRPAADPMYYLAVCSRNPAALPATLNRLSLFSDTVDTVYHDYVKQTRRGIELDLLRLKNHEQVIAERDAQLAQCAGRLDHSTAQIAAQEAQIAELQRHLEARASLSWWLRLPLVIARRIFKIGN